MKGLTADTLLREKRNDFKFELISGASLIKRRRITTTDVFRPGLAIAGFTDYFLKERVMIIGETEMSYLRTLAPAVRQKRVATIMKFCPPLVVITKKLRIDRNIVSEAEKRGIPILRTAMSTTPFIRGLMTYLDFKLSPTEYVHGTVVDIYGVGVLLKGKPGTGKSECALDLVERGHRLVADDLVKVIRRGEIIIATGAEKSDRLRHHLEIRGAGIVDMYRIFGVKSVRLRKRIEMVLELVFWNEVKGDYDRFGFDDRTECLLGVKIPKVSIPLTPGKNISVIAEVLAMNYLLKLRGHNSAHEYNRELKRLLAGSEQAEMYSSEDVE